MKAKAKKLTRYQNEGEVSKTKNRKNLLGQNVYKEKGTDSSGKSYKFKYVTNNKGDEVRSSYKTRGSGSGTSARDMSKIDGRQGEDTSNQNAIPKPGNANIMVTPGMIKKKGGSISRMKPMMKKSTKKK